MSHRTRFKVCKQDAPIPFPTHVRRQLTTKRPVVQTYSQMLQEQERRRTEAAETEAQRLAQALDSRADLDARLRAARAQRAKDEAARIVARKAAKAKHQRDYNAAMREAGEAFANGLDEELLNGFFREAYQRIAGMPY